MIPVYQRKSKQFSEYEDVSCLLGSCVSVVIINKKTKKGYMSHCFVEQDIYRLTIDMLAEMTDKGSSIAKYIPINKRDVGKNRKE